MVFGSHLRAAANWWLQSKTKLVSNCCDKPNTKRFCSENCYHGRNCPPKRVTSSLCKYVISESRGPSTRISWSVLTKKCAFSLQYYSNIVPLKLTSNLTTMFSKLTNLHFKSERAPSNFLAFVILSLLMMEKGCWGHPLNGGSKGNQILLRRVVCNCRKESEISWLKEQY